MKEIVLVGKYANVGSEDYNKGYKSGYVKGYIAAANELKQLIDDSVLKMLDETADE